MLFNSNTHNASASPGSLDCMGRTPLADYLPDGVDLRCIACGGLLYFRPDSYPLTFQCGNNHFMTLADLLDDTLPRGEMTCIPPLEFWPQKAMLFRRLARRALERGHPFAAADFQEAANRIDQWAGNLRALLSKESVP
jgi:hypothetical protein